MSDPYQPPTSNTQQVGQPALYSLQGIIVATILGSLAAAVVILYLNYRSLNAQSLAQKTAVGGIIFYLLLIGVAALLPDSMLLSGVFIVVQTAVAYMVAHRLQGTAIAYHPSPRNTNTGVLSMDALVKVLKQAKDLSLS